MKNSLRFFSIIITTIAMTGIFTTFIIGCIYVEDNSDEELYWMTHGAKRIFVTYYDYTGDLDGVTGADYRCWADPNRPDSYLGWKALVTDPIFRTMYYDWPLKPNTIYIRTNGTLIGITNIYGYFDFPLDNSISTVSKEAWTGLSPTWGPASNCHNWTSSDGLSYSGTCGDVTSILDFSINSALIGCDNYRFIYCVEQ